MTKKLNLDPSWPFRSFWIVFSLPGYTSRLLQGTAVLVGFRSSPKLREVQCQRLDEMPRDEAPWGTFTKSHKGRVKKPKEKENTKDWKRNNIYLDFLKHIFGCFWGWFLAFPKARTSFFCLSDKDPKVARITRPAITVRFQRLGRSDSTPSTNGAASSSSPSTRAVRAAMAASRWRRPERKGDFRAKGKAGRLKLESWKVFIFKTIQNPKCASSAGRIDLCYT